MSQVHEMVFPEPLKEVISFFISDDVQILTVKDLNKWESFLKVVFSKSTHYQKKENSTYEEHVRQFKVVSVIKSSRFKAGDLFWVWEKPAYSLDSIKLEHEEGILESPVVEVREPDYPVEGDKLIVFIKKLDKQNDKLSELYSISFQEGVKDEKEIKKK